MALPLTILVAAALAATTLAVAIPEGVARTDWASAAELTGFVLAPPGEAAAVELTVADGDWFVVVPGAATRVAIAAPDTPAAREDVLRLARSLLEPMSSAPLLSRPPGPSRPPLPGVAPPKAGLAEQTGPAPARASGPQPSRPPVANAAAIQPAPDARAPGTGPPGGQVEGIAQPHSPSPAAPSVPLAPLPAVVPYASVETSRAEPPPVAAPESVTVPLAPAVAALPPPAAPTRFSGWLRVDGGVALRDAIAPGAEVSLAAGVARNAWSLGACVHVTSSRPVTLFDGDKRLDAFDLRLGVWWSAPGPVAPVAGLAFGGSARTWSMDGAPLTTVWVPLVSAEAGLAWTPAVGVTLQVLARADDDLAATLLAEGDDPAQWVSPWQGQLGVAALFRR